MLIRIKKKKQDDGWFGYINTALSAGSAYLPSTVTETLLQVILSHILSATSMAVMLIVMMMMFSNYDHFQGRAFASVHLNQLGSRNICALAVIRRSLRCNL